ncbi:MAG TPA: acyl-CoA dehydrogenase family protein [Solirubrobacteraceae bacterium]|nr:acyl-CoA dehydrogenase family protein [Solirubrobacteraceae bacterium]
MNFRYTDEQLELRDRAAALTDEIMAYEEECEEHRGLSAQSLSEIRDLTLKASLNAINMPLEWGGQGLSILDQVIVQERLGQLTNALWDAVWRPANALKHCTAEQRERYLLPAIAGDRRDCFAVTEEKAGSDPSLIETVAQRDGETYRITGEKWFVTVGDVADFLIVQALVGSERAPTLFLVDKDLPGVSVKRTPAYMHTFVFEHPEFVFDEVALGSEQILGEVGGGYELTRDWFVEERLMIAARATGAAERALTLASDWANERVQSGGVLASHQLIGAMIADSTCDIALCRALTHQVAWEADHGMPRKLVHAKAAMVKLTASEAAGRVIDRAVQIFGGRGYMRENPVERLYRDIRVDRIWEGTSEIQRMIIAGEARKRGLDGMLQYGAGLPAEEAVHA